MATLPSGEVLGLQEIASLLEVAKRTPHEWKNRGVLPDPDYPGTVSGLAAWYRATILQWASETGRLPEALYDEAGVTAADLPKRRGPKR